jgi:hypothetical protein
VLGESVQAESCLKCGSMNLGQFTAEINIHFPGVDCLTKPTVWVFPELWVCLACGVAQFSVPDGELSRLDGK